MGMSGGHTSFKMEKEASEGRGLVKQKKGTVPELFGTKEEQWNRLQGTNKKDLCKGRSRRERICKARPR